MGAKTIVRVVSASAVFLLMMALFMSMSLSYLHESPITALISTVLAVASFGATLLCWDIARLGPDDKHTVSSLLHMYRQFRFTSPRKEWQAHMTFETLAEDGKKAQEECLMKMIKENCNTAYGKDYRLDEIKNREDFVKNHPLTDYSHYENYCARIAEGEQNVLTSAEVFYLGLSSGTTGKTKVYPITHALDDAAEFLFRYMVHKLRPIYNETGLQKRFLFRVFHPQRRSQGGILMGGLGQAVLTSDPGDGNVTPDGFLEIFDEQAIFYAQALFALADREVGTIEGFSADLMYSLFTFMIKNKNELCKDIERGDIECFPKLPEHVRQKMAETLYPDRRRASEVYTILSGSTVGLARRLWPKLRFVLVAKGGGFANSYRLLAKTYLEGVVSSCPVHGATEGIVGLAHASDPLEAEIYTFIPHITFFEFIPLEERSSASPKTLFLDQVEVGKQYEVVVSNAYGLYRNRYGDAVEIVGFHKTLPKYKFLYRCGHILNIAYDRTPESRLYEALRRTEAFWNGPTIDDYTATESFHVEELLGEVFMPACYILFLEVTHGRKEAPLTEKHSKMFDDILCETHETYKEYREKGSVGPAKIIQVKQGTFSHLKDVIQGERVNLQFKMPRVQRKEPLLRVLMNGMIQCL